MKKLPSAERILSRVKLLVEAVSGELSDATKDIINSSGITEQDDFYFVKIDMPGFSKEEIDLEIDGNTLRAKAKRKEERQEDGSYSFSEKSKDKATRIPLNADLDTATAKYKDGVILVRFNKLDKGAKPIIIDDNIK